MEKILWIIAYVANLILPDSWAYALAHMVAANDPLPPDNNKKTLIVPVAHGTTKNRLTCGSFNVCSRVNQLLKQFPNSIVVFGSFAGSNIEMEKKLKLEMLASANVHHYGSAMSTIDEPVGVLRLIGDVDFKQVIFLTDEAHSYRGGRIIFTTFFLHTSVYVVAIPLILAVDPGSLMENYRNPWKALVYQVLPTPIYWWWARKGPLYLITKADFHQPVAK